MRVAFVLALLLAACASPAVESDSPLRAAVSATPVTPVAAGLDITGICAGTTYGGCRESLTLAADVFSGEIVAVCEYPDGTGDVILLETEADAEAACSADGLIAGSRVVKVLELP